jgi:plasmid stabilization system protein ParE
MTFKLRLSAEALADLERLPAFLEVASRGTADKVRVALADGLASLSEMPGRGRPTADPDIRDLPVAFGRYGYLISYSVDSDEVFVIRIRHARERR